MLKWANRGGGGKICKIVLRSLTMPPLRIAGLTIAALIAALLFVVAPAMAQQTEIERVIPGSGTYDVKEIVNVDEDGTIMVGVGWMDMDNAFVVTLRGSVAVTNVGIDGVGVGIGFLGNGNTLTLARGFRVEADDWGVGIFGNNNRLILDHGVIVHGDERGILITGNNNRLTIASTASVISETGFAILFDSGNTDNTLVIGLDGDTGTFTNGGNLFGVDRANVITFQSNANIAIGGFTLFETIDVAANRNVTLGEDFLLWIGDDANLSVAEGSRFVFLGNLYNSDDVTIDVDGGGRAYLFGHIDVERLDTEGAIINVGENVRGTTLGINFDDVLNTGQMENLNVHMFDGSRFEFFASSILVDDLATISTDTIPFFIITVENGETAQLVNRSVFHDFRFRVEEIDREHIEVFYNGTVTNANMNDGFLAAALMHQRYTGYNMVRDHFISAGRRNATAWCAAALCDPCAPVSCDPCAPARGLGRGTPVARSAWVNYVGRATTYQGYQMTITEAHVDGTNYTLTTRRNGNSWKMGFDGVQVGTDLFRSTNTQFGAIFGYEGGWATKDMGDNIDRVDSDNLYFGLYGARVLRNGVDLRFVYNHGWQEFRMNRSGWESKFNGRTNEINLEMGRRFHRGAWSLRPFGGLDFHITHLDGTVENGAGGYFDPAVAYSKLNMTQTFLRSGVDLRYERNRFGLNTGLSYAFEVNNPKFRTWVTEVRDTPVHISEGAWLQGSKIGRELLTANVGGSYRIGRHFTAFGGYDLQAVTDRKGGVQHVGHVGGRVSW